MKPIQVYFRWLIVAAVLGFLSRTLWLHWQEVAHVEISSRGWGCLGLSLLLSLGAHGFAGWVWGWILQGCQQPMSGTWSTRVYLITNLAKYLPGNIWHFYGRIQACQAVGIPLEPALLSVLLEPVLMAAAALTLTLLGLQAMAQVLPPLVLGVPLLGWGAILAGIQPRVLNRLLRYASLKKQRSLAQQGLEIQAQVKMQDYPLRPLVGELIFLGLRGTGFIVAWIAIHPVSWTQLPLLYSSFSAAWLLGLIVPGLPGGVGLFEAVMLALLKTQIVTGELLTILALYRLTNTLAEALGAGLASLRPSATQ
jgi:hypothetical protein